MGGGTPIGGSRVRLVLAFVTGVILMAKALMPGSGGDARPRRSLDTDIYAG
jgi:hypothetical protein